MDVSEEVQMQGRTARQGKKGTFSMILQADELQKDLALSRNFLGEGQANGYKTMKTARCSKQQQRFAAIQKQAKEAAESDSSTHKYFDSLLAGDAGAAKTLFKELYKKSVYGSGDCMQTCFHYIVCLDESSSMQEDGKFDLAKAAAINFVRKALTLNAKTGGSVVSIVMFNHTARVVCQERALSQVSESDITFSGGQTSFEAPLSRAASLIQASLERYQKHCILFYTDGVAYYPEGAVQALSGLMCQNLGKIDLFAIAEDDAPILMQICQALFGGDAAGQHCLRKVQPEQIAGKMVEALQRMHMGYVRET
eukprot:2332530-Amphidinium_carterae.1